MSNNKKKLNLIGLIIIALSIYTLGVKNLIAFFVLEEENRVFLGGGGELTRRK
jgi:hypothetical protein